MLVVTQPQTARTNVTSVPEPVIVRDTSREKFASTSGRMAVESSRDQARELEWLVPLDAVTGRLDHDHLRIRLASHQLRDVFVTDDR